jgi:S1-C subfamily serine protease
VAFTVIREGQEMAFKVKLGKQFPAHLGITFGDTLHVIDLAKESPARRGGVQLEDVVVAIDGKNLGTPAELIGYLRDKKPGDVVTLTVKRNNAEVKVEVKLGKRPGY